MKRKVTFNKSGSGSISGRVIIPAAYLELLEVTEKERELDITFKDGAVILKKSKSQKGD